MIPARCFFRFLAVLTFAVFGGAGHALSAPVVIFKLDELNTTTFTRIVDFLIAEGATWP